MKRVSVAVLAVAAVLTSGGTRLKAQQPGSVCVREVRPATKTVYACQEEEYCLPRCGLLSWVLGQCGCGDVRVRHRLVVKHVPDGGTQRCVPRGGPAAGPAK
jgi:hypothetical protein